MPGFLSKLLNIHAVPSAYARDIASTLQAQDADVVSILKKAGLSPEDLDKPTIPLSAYGALHQAAMVASQNDFLGYPI